MNTGILLEKKVSFWVKMTFCIFPVTHIFGHFYKICDTTVQISYCLTFTAFKYEDDRLHMYNI